MQEALIGMGIPAIGFAFLYYALNQMFKTHSQYFNEINKLYLKIEELLRIINLSQISDIEFKNRLNTVIEITEKMQTRTNTLIETQNLKLDNIHLLCEKINTDRRKIPIEKLLIAKGCISERQLDEAIKEQNKLLE